MTPTQHRAALALIQQPTVRQAADTAGISERTLYRWLEREDFKALIRQYQDAAIADAIRRMSGGAALAVDTLLALIADPDVRASSRINACRILLGEFRQLREFGELANRVAVLEARAGASNG